MQDDVSLTPPQIPCLAMRLPDAAKALSLSERQLWQMVHDDAIPHVRLGKVILLPVDSLRDWLKTEASGGTK